jgi:dTMP kinase
MGSEGQKMTQDNKGVFIVVEGPDGVGTTTQAHALKAALEARGDKVHVTQEPSSGPIGRLIRERLQASASDEAYWRTLALLFAADRVDHVSHEIQPKLDAGVHVISDRYTLSSLVYQGLHVPDAWVFDLNRHARRPDVSLVLHLPREEAWKRAQERQGTKEIYDDPELQRHVHERYGELGKRMAGVAVDASGSIEEVTERLMAVLVERELIQAP